MIARHGWRGWIGYAAAAWSLAYAALGLFWATGGTGFPFGRDNDPQAFESILEGVEAGSGAPAIVILGLLGALVALTLTEARPRRFARALLLVFAVIAALSLLVVIPDRRLLVAVAYAPLFLIGAPFGWPPASFSDAVTWPVINQLVLVAGGLLWAGTALAYGAPADQRSGWTTPEAAARWGRWAVAVAVVVPLIYAATRFAWALCIPLGIDDAFFREGQASGLWIAGAGLATVAVAGAILTLGLVQRWGEVFPRWMVGLAGKPVPPALAIVPAILVSIIVTAAGLSYVRLFVSEGMPREEWALIGPELLWPIWGVALALAVLAYYYRRRGDGYRLTTHDCRLTTAD